MKFSEPPTSCGRARNKVKNEIASCFTEVHHGDDFTTPL